MVQTKKKCSVSLLRVIELCIEVLLTSWFLLGLVILRNIMACKPLTVSAFIHRASFHVSAFSQTLLDIDLSIPGELHLR